MTIGETINNVSSVRKGNRYSEKEIISWLSELDGIIKSETIDTHVGSENVVFNGYTSETDPDTKLLAADPYGDIYIYYALAKIDFFSNDMTRYNNDMVLFNDAKRRFTDWYNRTHASNGISNLRW